MSGNIGKLMKEFLNKINKSGYKAIWDECAGLDMPEAPDTHQEWVKLQRSIKNLEEEKMRSFFFSWFAPVSPKMALVYSFAAIIFISTLLFLYQLAGPTIYQAANKEQITVTLADGSTVRLNAGSNLSVDQDFNSEIRNVTLRGEAFFEVAKNKGKPFYVNTECGRVRVVGTQFNIRARDDKMTVAVNEGIVQVTSTSTPKDSSVTLIKGQMTNCSVGGYPSAVQQFSINQSPAWLYSKMVLDHEPIAYVFEEIERRFDVEINYPEADLKDIKISGLFNTVNLNSLMSSLCIVINKEYKYEDNTITVL